MSFSEKVVLVTGAGSGIGAEISVKFSSESASVVLVGRNEIKMNGVAQKCSEAGGNPLVIVADVTVDADVKRVFTIIIEHFGKLDIVINNAGVAGAESILSEGAITVFDKIMKVNLRAVMLISHLSLPHLLETKGNIINISSIGSSSICFRVNSQYCTSKAGLDQFTKCAALELEPYGVRVNSVNPGPVKTNFMEAVGLTAEQQEQLRDTLLRGTLLNKIIEPSEVADLVLYLASDKARGITGSSLVIDSGVLLKGLIDG
ncbi:unnamed protein product, partial [Iphiclides podalirius]